MYKFDFKNKENYELVTKYLEKLPCEECLVRAICLNATINNVDGWYEIYLNQPCDEAMMWWNKAVVIGRFLYMLTDQDYKLSDRKETMRRFKRICKAMSISIEI